MLCKCIIHFLSRLEVCFYSFNVHNLRILMKKTCRFFYKKTKKWTFKGYVLHWQKQFWTAAQTTYMYINIDRKMKLVHILYKNPCTSLLLEKERVAICVKCLDEHIWWNYYKLFQTNFLQVPDSDLIHEKKCAKKIRGGGEGLPPPLWPPLAVIKAVRNF